MSIKITGSKLFKPQRHSEFVNHIEKTISQKNHEIKRAYGKIIAYLYKKKEDSKRTTRMKYQEYRISNLLLEEKGYFILNDIIFLIVFILTYKWLSKNEKTSYIMKCYQSSVFNNKRFHEIWFYWERLTSYSE